VFTNNTCNDYNKLLLTAMKIQKHLMSNFWYHNKRAVTIEKYDLTKIKISKYYLHNRFTMNFVCKRFYSNIAYFDSDKNNFNNDWQ